MPGTIGGDGGGASETALRLRLAITVSLAIGSRVGDGRSGWQVGASPTSWLTNCWTSRRPQRSIRTSLRVLTSSRSSWTSQRSCWTLLELSLDEPPADDDEEPPDEPPDDDPPVRLSFL